jgi:hypothetical protein
MLQLSRRDVFYMGFMTMLLISYDLFAVGSVGVHASDHSDRKRSKKVASNEQELLLFGVITPECLDIFLNKHDFTNVPCIKFVISKAIGYAIITGSLILKVLSLCFLYFPLFFSLIFFNTIL